MFKKTIFSHIIYINMITVIIGIVFLTVLQSYLWGRYMDYSTEEKLRDNAKAIVHMINKEGTLSNERVRSYLEGFSKSSDYSVFVVDKDGRIALDIVTGEEFNDNTKYISKSYLRGSEYIITGNLDGAFKTDMDIYFAPIMETDASGNASELGEIIISTPQPADSELVGQLLKIAIYSTLVVLAIAFMFAYYSSEKIVQPIKKIGDEAKKFAKGEFGARVNLTKSDCKVKEINDLAETFNNMASELEKFEDVRSNFISDVSHELRTPMTTITGFVDGILDGTIPQDKEKEYLQLVHEECIRLSKLVNSFLDVTRNLNQKIKLEFTDFDINRLITTTVVGMESRIEEKNIKVNIEFCDDTCPVFADKDGIKRVMTNLMDNAVKFTPTEGEILVKLRNLKREISVSVRNSGSGISSEEQKLIFERFYKEDKSRSENKSGTGIGLYIVKSMINAHGKNITVESDGSEYTEFKFTLEKGRM